MTLAVVTGTATLSIAAVSVDEADGTATVSVTVDAEVTDGFSVDAMTADGTATAPGDYTAVSGQTLSFAGTFVGETQTFTVTIIDDPIYEGGTSGVPETVAVSLGNLRDNATDVDISSAAATISITDNDYEVALTMEDVSVSEGVGSTATVIVSVDTRVPGAFSVEASTADGTATAPGDYDAVSDHVLSFTGEANETQTFSVPITNDNTREFPETLTVSLSNLQVTTDTATTMGTLLPVSATITIMDDDVSTGGVNLNLRFPVTINGKTYFYLDNNGNGIADVGDAVTHRILNDLLNGGSPTDATLDGAHNGQDDARSVIVGDTAVILPTLNELMALRSDLAITIAPVSWWQQPQLLSGYWTSTRSTKGHFHYRFSDEVASDRHDLNSNQVAFQVRTLPTFSVGIADQTYTVGQPVAVALTLPEAAGGVGTLTYTLTRDDDSPVLPVGLSFNPAERTISGMPSVGFGDTAGASMRYTVTDSTGAVRDIPFRLRVVIADLVFDTSATPTPDSAYTYTAGTAITPLTLPPATGGIAPLTYSLTPTSFIPEGLTFDATERTLSGTPATATVADLTYAVTDANGVVVTAAFTVTITSDSVLAVNSVGYYADEAATIPITETVIGGRFYTVVQFSENVRHILSADSGANTGQPGIIVRVSSVIPGVTPTLRAHIIAHDAAFVNRDHECRTRKSASDTSEYICQVILGTTGTLTQGPLQVEVQVGDAHDSDGNTLAELYTDSSIRVVVTPDPPMVNPPITHYSDAGRTAPINGTVTGGTIYSVVQFTGLHIVSPALFYQIGTDATARVQFGGHVPTGDTPPPNGTCAFLSGGSTAAADQSFWCRYNPRAGDSGTYQVIVGTGTRDVAGQTLDEYTGDAGVMLNVASDAGTATLSIEDVAVDEGAGTATVSVTVDDAVTGGFKVDAMTADGTDTAATADEDYAAVTGQTLTFTGDDDETRTFTVTILDDPIYEGGASGVPETVAVSLVNLRDNATDVDINSAAATISITDNDYEVALTMEDVSVNESAGTATVSVSLDTMVTGAFSVVASTADGTATAPGDYTAVLGQTLSFTGDPADGPQTFSVPITNDNTREFPETLTVSLSNLQVLTDTATTVGTLRPVSATITIMDDDVSTGGVNLNLRFPVTINGKTYFYLDHDGDGIADAGDAVTHRILNDLLNGGSPTDATQPGGHNGRDDERSVIVGDTAVILPTVDELMALRSDLARTTAPVNWWQHPIVAITTGGYWTSVRSTTGHFHYRFSDEAMTPRHDLNSNHVAFQVHELPIFSAGHRRPDLHDRPAGHADAARSRRRCRHAKLHADARRWLAGGVAGRAVL